MNKDYDVVVIGAGQAGLAMGYYLGKTGLSYVLLDANPQVGDSWRNRYDSLVLFTPRSYSDLPGYPFPGERSGLPNKDDVADYLALYATKFQLPIHQGTVVQKLNKMPEGFQITTNKGEYSAKRVVVATGPFHTPFVPKWSESIASDIYQVHTAAYKNPDELQEGPVLVVGMGNSGAQIAVEIAENHEVFLANGQARKFLPITILGKSIFWYFEKIGFLSTTIDDKLGNWLSNKPDPIFGYGKELKALVNRGHIIEKPRAIEANGEQIRFVDGTNVVVKNIIWATGFKPDYSWIDIPTVLNGQGKPVHKRGISPIEGLYFLGLPWQYKRGSALLGGVGEDAHYLFNYIRTRDI
jgi:putative flavoprotein involved in K+ transport